MAEGYTKIENKIFEGLARLRIKGASFRVLMAIIRNTKCYGKDSQPLSNGFLMKATGLSEMSVIRAIKELSSLKIIKITEKGSGTRPKIIRLSTNRIVTLTQTKGGTNTDGSVSTSADDSTSTNRDVTQEIKEKKDINKRKKKKPDFFSSMEEAKQWYEDHPEELEDDDV